MKQQKPHKKQYIWNDERTLTFFKIVDIHRPFDSQHGKVTEAWEKTAKEYNGSINEPDALNGKTGRDYYKAVLKKHREATVRSNKASGVDEEVTELTTILDAAVELGDSLQKATPLLFPRKLTFSKFKVQTL